MSYTHSVPRGSLLRIQFIIMKKNIYKVSGLILSIVLITPLFAAAQSNTDVTSQIQALLSQITALQTQLHTHLSPAASTTTHGGDSGTGWNTGAGTSTPPTSSGGHCPQITRDLSIGSHGNDVSDLQDTLRDDGFLSASSTGFFGQMTARALSEFQKHFGITASSTGGFLGPITRNFFENRCGGPGGGMGSSTPPTAGGDHWGQEGGAWPFGSTTPPVRPPHATSTPPFGGEGGWNNGTSTNGDHWNGPLMGSTTPPHPCGQDNGGDGGNAAAAALFVPHSITPGGRPPCGNGASGEMHQ